MSLGSISLCGNGKSWCGNGKPSGSFEPPKFNPEPIHKEIMKNQMLYDIIIFLRINPLLTKADINKCLIMPHLVVMPNGRCKLSRTDSKNGLLKKDTNSHIIDVANNPHLALPAKAFKRLYTEVPAAPNNNPYTVVNIYTLYGDKLGGIWVVMLSLNTGHAFKANILVQDNKVNSVIKSLDTLGTISTKVEFICANAFGKVFITSVARIKLSLILVNILSTSSLLLFSTGAAQTFVIWNTINIWKLNIVKKN